VKVATRITLATAVVVTLTSGVYAYFDLRARARERMDRVEREGIALATALRVSLEASPEAARKPPGELSRDLSRAVGSWKVTILPRTLLASTVIGDPPPAPGQLRRLRALVELPNRVISDRGDDGVAVATPLVVVAANGGREVTGAIEVAHSTEFLDDAADDDRWGAITLVALIAAAATLAVALVTSNLITRRIKKLLRGIDDVAKGDLSHVLLSDRDDEIGAITTRFNEMTFSLRESRAETQRQNQAKLDLELRLGQTEKLATIGQLAAEIAHEVGTPLNVIAGRARSTQKKSADPEQVEKNATIIAEQTARITKIIQRLLDFARRKVGSHEPARVELNQVTLTTMELLAGQFASAKIKPRLVRAEGLPWVSGEADRLQQVVINLVMNAVQAMPDGGNLEVETSEVTRTRPGLDDARPQTFVCIRVTDAGVGIPADIRDKIFDPFYTTKEGDGGTGLGLAVCSGIVKEHDGWIELADAPAGGSTFRVFVPAGEA
jgi:signal transduction histidine kinase